jgi:hypothetical protein
MDGGTLFLRMNGAGSGVNGKRRICVDFILTIIFNKKPKNPCIFIL